MTGSTHPRYRSPCGWNALLPPRRGVRVLEGGVSADAVIVGAGYTGLAAARRWTELRPNDAVVVLDSSEVGEGSPGRNSGFLLEIALANDADASQIERMRACNRLIGSSMATIRRLVTDHGIDCGLERAGTYRAAAGPAGRKALAAYRKFLEAAELPCESLDREAIRSRLGTSFYAEGLYSPHCYLAQPAALIRGLASILPDAVSLYERSPALRVSRADGAWRVETPGGTAAAPVVLLANNAFTKGLGYARSRLSAMYTYAGLTEPLPADALAMLGSESSWGLLPTHRLGSTLRRTPDGRLLIRSDYGYERETDTATIGRRLAARLERRYPDLGRVEFASVWAGATGFTLNGAPVWGELEPGLFAASGCNGGGVVKGTLFGELLAAHAQGLEVPDVRGLFGSASWMPPEPIRRLGFHVVATLEQRHGRPEM